MNDYKLKSDSMNTFVTVDLNKMFSAYHLCQLVKNKITDVSETVWPLR